MASNDTDTPTDLEAAQMMGRPEDFSHLMMPPPSEDTVARMDGCRFCKCVARFGPSQGQPCLEHRHEHVAGKLRAVTDDATALDGSQTTGYFDEAARMWLPMPNGGAL